MRKLLIISLMMIFKMANSQNHRIMTFNIRYNTEKDGENQWNNRKDHVAEYLKYYHVDICGMQEALLGQITDLKDRLPGYSWFGLGRDDGKGKGEFSPIFYNSVKIKMLKNGTFWLSENMDVPGKGWDASLPRVVSWGSFQSIKSKKKFFVFNTHFDHLGKVARVQSAQLLLKEIRSIAGKNTAIVLGDFNATPDSEPIKILLSGLRNTEQLSQTPHFGPNDTFNGFDSKEKPNSQIDHIFTNNPNLKVISHGTLSNTWGGLFASDHHPVMIEIKLK